MHWPTPARRRAALHAGVRLYLPILATFATVAPLAGAHHLGDGAVVLGVVIGLLSGRAVARGGRKHALTTLLRVPFITAAVAGLAAFEGHHRWLLDIAFVAVVTAATFARTYGPVVAGVVRTFATPLVALFIAPGPVTGHRAHDAWWSVAIALIAVVYVVLLAIVWPTPAQDHPAPHAPMAVAARLALQHALTLTAAFVLSQNLFPDHWTWMVITAYVVTAGARSRGDVVLKAIQRLGGAFVGTAVATGIGALIGGHRTTAVVVIFVMIGIGLVLRELSYVWWALMVTALLAVLYTLLGQPATLGRLGERLLEIFIGGVLAVLPACVVRPIRTGSVVRRRTGASLRAMRELVEKADDPLVRPIAASRLVEELTVLGQAAAPLMWLPQTRTRTEAQWAKRMASGLPPARSLARATGPTDDAVAGSVARLRALLREVGREYRATGAAVGQ